MEERPPTMRLARTVEDATSNTQTARVAACMWTPMMSLPSAEGRRMLLAAKAMMPLGGGRVGVTGAGGVTVTAARALEASAVGSYVISTRSEERRVGKECRSRWSP